MATPNALAVVESEKGLVKSKRLQDMRRALEEEAEIREMTQEYITKHMREDTDFGVIPGTKDKALLKPGAEKLTELFRCTPKFALLKQEEDFDAGFCNYMFRVRMVQRDGGAVLAEGFGSANSREGRYRWRNAKLKCPDCKQETVLKSRNNGGGFFCWGKKGGCGTVFAEDDKRITEQKLGKVENDDVATLFNTILKMAKKRAHVDAAIALARCSDMFTQDEDEIAAQGGRGAPSGPPEDGEPPHPAGETSTSKPPAQEKQPEKPAAVTKPPPVKVTDVQPGETEEEASAREAQEALRRSDEAAKAQAPKAAQAIRARVAKIWNRARATGMDVVSFRKWTINLLGRDKESKDWTADDCAVLEGGLTGAEQVHGEAP